MGRKHQLAELQLAIMQVLWERGKVTVAEVRDAARSDRPGIRSPGPARPARGADRPAFALPPLRSTDTLLGAPRWRSLDKGTRIN